MMKRLDFLAQELLLTQGPAVNYLSIIDTHKQNVCD